MHMILPLLITFTILFSPLACAEQEQHRYKIIANRMVEAFNAKDYSAISQDYADVLSHAFPQQASQTFFKNLMANHGLITKLEHPRFTIPGQAIFLAQFQNGRLDIKIVLNAQDKMIGLWFLPPTASIPVIKKHKTVLNLPFNGEWLVLWGGDSKEQNHHFNSINQHYAFDFLMVNDSGRTHRNEGRNNGDYFAFGQNVLAPAEGVVTDVVSGVRDNLPGSMNPYSALGNAVFIQHQPYEVSVLAHLKQGSIKVKVGDKVVGGEVIGLCGNSGNSSEPHLHYHLQNTPIIQDGTGIKCFFAEVFVTSKGEKLIKRYSPVKNDLIRKIRN